MIEGYTCLLRLLVSFVQVLAVGMRIAFIWTRFDTKLSFCSTVQVGVIDYRKANGHVIKLSLENFNIESLILYLLAR